MGAYPPISIDFATIESLIFTLLNFNDLYFIRIVA